MQKSRTSRTKRPDRSTPDVAVDDITMRMADGLGWERRHPIVLALWELIVLIANVHHSAHFV